MKTIYDVIEKDTKWFLHFLKEKHIKTQFFEKRNKQHPKCKCFTYNDWVKHIKDNLIFYMFPYNYHIENKEWEIFLKVTDRLINSSILFSGWWEKPYTLDNISSYEADKWLIFKTDYIDLKTLLFVINAHGRY